MVSLPAGMDILDLEDDDAAGMSLLMLRPPEHDSGPTSHDSGRGFEGIRGDSGEKGATRAGHVQWALPCGHSQASSGCSRRLSNFSQHLSRQDLSHKYELETLLGSGASAEVYAAIDKETDERVAIKIFSSCTSETIHAACTEYVCSMRCTAPTVINCIALAFMKDKPAIVQELADCSLADWIQQQMYLRLGGQEWATSSPSACSERTCSTFSTTSSENEHPADAVGGIHDLGSQLQTIDVHCNKASSQQGTSAGSSFGVHALNTQPVHAIRTIALNVGHSCTSTTATLHSGGNSGNATTNSNGTKMEESVFSQAAPSQRSCEWLTRLESGEDIGPRQAEIMFIVMALLDGLVVMHSSGLAHCDLKPQNVVLMEDGSAKLADLGAACAIQPQTGMLSVMASHHEHVDRLVQTLNAQLAGSEDCVPPVMPRTSPGKLPATGPALDASGSGVRSRSAVCLGTRGSRLDSVLSPCSSEESFLEGPWARSRSACGSLVMKTPTYSMRQVPMFTSAYSSPERSNESDQRKVDVWAAGCVLYEICTGHRIVNAKSEVDNFRLRAQMCNSDWRPPRLPRGMTAWQPLLDAMLDKNPDTRPLPAQLLDFEIFAPIRSQRRSKRMSLRGLCPTGSMRHDYTSSFAVALQPRRSVRSESASHSVLAGASSSEADSLSPGRRGSTAHKPTMRVSM